MKDKLTILNAFVHDVATGTWLSTLILLTLLHREAEAPAWSSAAALVAPLERKFLVLTWSSLGIILATGIVRMWTFKVFGWTGDIAAAGQPHERLEVVGTAAFAAAVVDALAAGAAASVPA